MPHRLFFYYMLLGIILFRTAACALLTFPVYLLQWQKARHKVPIPENQKLLQEVFDMSHIIALAQCGSLPDTAQNLKTAECYVRQAADARAALIVFPEYFMYPCHKNSELYVGHAQSIDGPFVSAMKELAAKYGIWILFGMNEAAPLLKAKKCFNTLVLLDNRGILRGTYQKTHLFDAFDWRESDHTAAGNALFTPVSTPFGRLGLGTCYDLRFPELARSAALRGAEIFIYPSAWVQGHMKAVQWKTLLAARAVENGMTVIGCSQYAEDIFIGQSFACDPFGRVLAKGDETSHMILVPVNPDDSVKARHLVPALEHMRKDLY